MMMKNNPQESTPESYLSTTTEGKTIKSEQSPRMPPRRRAPTRTQSDDGASSSSLHALRMSLASPSSKDNDNGNDRVVPQRGLERSLSSDAVLLPSPRKQRRGGRRIVPTETLPAPPALALVELDSDDENDEG